jgi:hypothetical protein
MMERIMQATACAFVLSVVTVGASFAQTAVPENPPLPPRTNPEWTTDVTVLVIAPDGTWGTATEPLIGRAYAKAIADCKSKHRHNIGCGYRSTTIRAGWSLAMRCGRKNIIVSAKTLQAAEQAAVDSELNLRRSYEPDMPPCVRVVSVNPDGGVIAPDTVDLLRFLIHRRRQDG